MTEDQARGKIEDIDASYEDVLARLRKLEQGEEVNEGDYSHLDGMWIRWGMDHRMDGTYGLRAFQPMYGSYIELTPDDLDGHEVYRLRD